MSNSNHQDNKNPQNASKYEKKPQDAADKPQDNANKSGRDGEKQSNKKCD